jgi:peroxiredoxin
MKAGDTAPNFTLKDESGNEFELYKNLNKSVLLVFYPKDETPVCSSQLAEYNSNLDKFTEQGIKLIGISTDSIESHKKFCSSINLKFPLLSDENKSVSRQYKALNIFSSGKRKLVLVNRDKNIVWIRNILPIYYLKTSEILSAVNKIALLNLT